MILASQRPLNRTPVTNGAETDCPVLSLLKDSLPVLVRYSTIDLYASPGYET